MGGGAVSSIIQIWDQLGVAHTETPALRRPKKVMAGSLRPWLATQCIARPGLKSNQNNINSLSKEKGLQSALVDWELALHVSSFCESDFGV